MPVKIGHVFANLGAILVELTPKLANLGRFWRIQHVKLSVLRLAPPPLTSRLHHQARADR